MKYLLSRYCTANLSYSSSWSRFKILISGILTSLSEWLTFDLVSNSAKKSSIFSVGLLSYFKPVYGFSCQGLALYKGSVLPNSILLFLS